MFSKLFLLVLLASYSANASVININILTDSVSGEKDVSVNEKMNSCNNRACNQLCLQLGFTGGVCVGDRCKCDNFKGLNDDDFSKNEVPHSSCDNKACDQLCRRLGFKDGLCADGRCKCDVFIGQNGLKSKAKITACNFQACNQLCRNLGFPGGACVGDKCDCDNFKPNKDDGPVLNFPRECNAVACNNMCRILNYIGGICNGSGSCECY